MKHLLASGPDAEILAAKPRFEILDGLRGVAALMVVAFHLLETYSGGSHFKQIINHGYLAVDFFFALAIVNAYAALRLYDIPVRSRLARKGQARGAAVKGGVLLLTLALWPLGGESATDARQAADASYIGIVKASEKVAVTSRITGTIWKQNFAEGACVKKGEVLFEIEDTVYRANLVAAEAARDELKANVVFAEKEVNRYRECVARKSVSESDFDRAVQARDTFAAQLRAAEAKVSLAANDLSYAKIVSPEDGVIGETKIRAGNNVDPTSGTLVEIVKVDPIRIKVAFAEKAFFRLFPNGRLKDGVTFSLVRADGLSLDRPVTVDFADNQVDPKTDTVMVQLSCSNADRALLPGGFVRVTCHER